MTGAPSGPAAGSRAPAPGKSSLGPGPDGAAGPPSPPGPLGAHVSVAGGLHRAPERGRRLGATAIQIFTKAPRRWAERELSDDEVAGFREAVAEAGIRCAVAHDSYLINLATPDPALFERSAAAFDAELERSVRLGLDDLVTHPGNATGGGRDAAIRRNADAIAASLGRHPGPTGVLLETTAGSGTALGWRFEELAALLDAVPAPERGRVGVCLDTAHVHAAGYDLRADYPGVIAELDAAVGLSRLRLLHLNDSAVDLGSRVDRHAHIGEGKLGEGAFAALMRDDRLRGVPRVLETPKDDDAEASDRRNLRRLRELGGF